MKHILYKINALFLIMLVFSFVSFPAFSGEEVNIKTRQDNNIKTLSISKKELLVARENLLGAIESYEKGNLLKTQQKLKTATEWLHKASQNSMTEKVRKEAVKLSSEIDSFKKSINKASEQQEYSLARFWYQATSMIERETDHLIHSYVELSVTEDTLKYLLDAKMHLFIAKHDLFVSYDDKEAIEELNTVLNYLDEAMQVANSVTKNKISALIKDIKSLKNKISSRKDGWKIRQITHSLENAVNELTQANKNASSSVKSRIEYIKANIRTLRNDIGSSRMKDHYKSSMASLVKIIKEL